VTAFADLSDVASCREVVRLQEAVWGAGSEIVPASVLIASAKRGGILIGAVDGGELLGFVWSMPAVRDAALTHWSHMLGVRPAARGRGIGRALKLAQRERAMAAGVELIEWTFDPLQAPNAHLNIAGLGGTASTYLVDAYGSMSGQLHLGTPTDRLIVEWRLRAPHVERRLARSGRQGAPLVRSAEILDVPTALAAADDARRAPGAPRLDLDARRLLIAIPPRFTELQQHNADAALAWRLAARSVFTTYFARGYRVVDFWLSRHQEGGNYLIEKVEKSRSREVEKSGSRRVERSKSREVEKSRSKSSLI
jgi:predicted GNAT superfamily acetyltransferase